MILYTTPQVRTRFNTSTYFLQPGPIVIAPQPSVLIAKMKMYGGVEMDYKNRYVVCLEVPQKSVVTLNGSQTLRTKSFNITIDESEEGDPRSTEGALDRVNNDMQQLVRLHAQLSVREISGSQDGDTAKCWQSEVAALRRKVFEWWEELDKLKRYLWLYSLGELHEFVGH